MESLNTQEKKIYDLLFLHKEDACDIFGDESSEKKTLADLQKKFIEANKSIAQ